MKKVLDWWRGRKWVYLGFSELTATKQQKTIDIGVVHFWMWQNNNKIRKFDFQSTNYSLSSFKAWNWYQKSMIPWLEGGDIWEPISTPIAVQGNLVNFYNGKNQP